MVTLQNSQSAEHPTESRSYEPASTERRPGSLCGRAGHKAYLTQIAPIEYDPTGIGAMAPTMITYDTIEPSMRCTEKDEESM